MQAKIIDQRINSSGPWLAREVELSYDKDGNITEVSVVKPDDVHFDLNDVGKEFAGGPAVTQFVTEITGGRVLNVEC